MIERLDKKATIRLLVAIAYQAKRDKRRFEKKRGKLNGGNYISSKSYESACHYIEEEIPVVQEILSEALRK